MYNVLDYLENSCNKFSNKIAVIEEDKELTYKELVNYSKSVGSFLSKKGALNEPIIIFMDKGIDTLISFFGSVYIFCNVLKNKMILLIFNGNIDQEIDVILLNNKIIKSLLIFFFINIFHFSK